MANTAIMVKIVTHMIPDRKVKKIENSSTLLAVVETSPTNVEMLRIV